MAIANLSRLLSASPSLTRERLREYLAEAGKEFSFTGFSSYFALARRTFQLAARGGHLEGLDAADRAKVLTEPDGIIVREIASLIGETEDFPSAWRFVRRDWTFSPQFRSLIGARIDPADPVSGPALQRLLAIANGAPVPEDATHVPLELRRER